MWSFVVSTPEPSVPISADAIITDTLSPVFNDLLQSVAHTEAKSKVSLLPRPKVEDSNPSSTAIEATVTTSRSVAICKGEGFFTGGKPRFISGSFRDTLSTVDGRDSILITELSILDCKAM